MKKLATKLCSLAIAACSLSALSAFDIGGYFENWAQYRGLKPDGSNRGVYPSCTPQGFSAVARSLTQFNYAYFLFNYNAAVSPTGVTNDWAVYPSEWNDLGNGNLVAQAGALKQVNSNVKIMLSIGGWNFCDPTSNYGSATYLFFQQLLNDTAKQDQFIASLDQYFQLKSGTCDYIFDGIDIDYEYPGQYRPGVSPSGPGAATDYQGMLTFLGKLRKGLDAYGQKYGKTFYISMAVPPFAPAGFQSGSTIGGTYPAGYTAPNGSVSYGAVTITNTNPSTYFAWYSIVANHCDWINLMTYDMYGAFNSPQKVQYQAPLYNGYNGAAPNTYDFTVIPDNTNLQAYSVDYGVQMWLEGSLDPGVLGSGVSPSKIRLGLPAYGRSYANTATFPSNPILQPFTTAGAIQPYTQQAGVADYYEIFALENPSKFLSNTSGGAPITSLSDDGTVAQSYLVTNNSKMNPANDVFVYDATTDFSNKVAYARRMQLGGVFVYALSEDNLSGGPTTYNFTQSLLLNGIIQPTNLYEGVNLDNGQDYSNRTPN